MINAHSVFYSCQVYFFKGTVNYTVVKTGMLYEGVQMAE